MNTKEKILEISQQHFNKEGFGEPTLQSLAKEIGISRGNLTYYFKNKEALLTTLVDKLFVTYQTRSAEVTHLPSWASLLDRTKVLHELQNEYAFIFFDKQVLLHPLVKSQIQKMRKDSLQNLMSLMQFSIQVGNMKPEPMPGIYYNINRTYWTISFYWNISKEFLLSKETSWDKMMWSLLLPHFTEKGIESFKQYFGEEYFQSLGLAFEDFFDKHSF